MGFQLTGLILVNATDVASLVLTAPEHECTPAVRSFRGIHEMSDSVPLPKSCHQVA